MKDAILGKDPQAPLEGAVLDELRRVPRATATLRLSAALRTACLFHSDNLSGWQQFNWLWWTALVSISAEEGTGELVRQSRIVVLSHNHIRFETQ